MELSTKQRRILELLSINARFSNKDIGKIVGLSEDAVAYQIKKLILKEKYARFYVQFDYPYQEKFQLYHILIRLNNLEFDKKAICTIPNTISINTSTGKYDVQVLAVTKSNEEYDKTIESLNSILSISNMTVLKYIGDYKQFTNVIPPISLNTPVPRNQKNFIYKLNSRIFPLKNPHGEWKIDESDKKIVMELLKDPLASYTKLATKTGLNHETVRTRMKAYVNSGFIINFGLMHDFKKYGLFTAHLLLNLNGEDKKKFSEYLLHNKNIFYSARLIGTYNCMVYVLAHNPDELSKHIREIRTVLGNSLKEFDLLMVENLYKYTQFPEGELTNTFTPE
ncbi:MAG: AsnC family transcriptional regulator [Candidatus Woesearchaeota archaeon]